MRDKPIVGRVNNNRAVSSLSSRLGDVLQRRRGEKAERQVQAIAQLKSGGVSKIHADELPLTELLEKSRFLSRPARGSNPLHVSDLVSKCLRKIALSEKLGMPHKPQNLRLTDLLTFAQGDAIHDVLKANAVRAGGGVVWGKWSCKCGTTKTPQPCLFSDLDKDKTCAACKQPVDVYEEVAVKDAELEIVGTPDLLLYMREHEALHITELKSISHDVWKELARPLPDHVIQVLFYWYLLSRAGYRLTDKVSILYATKGWMFSGNPTKEFVVDAESQIHRLDDYLADAAAVKVSRAGGDLPTRTCPTPTSPEAKKCELCSACFGVNENEKPKIISASEALGSRPVTVRRRTP